MNRDDDWALLCEYTQGDSLRKHMLAVESAMRAYARRLGEYEETSDVPIRPITRCRVR